MDRTFHYTTETARTLYIVNITSSNLSKETSYGFLFQCKINQQNRLKFYQNKQYQMYLSQHVEKNSSFLKYSKNNLKHLELFEFIAILR